jgi:Cyclic nucleotide-binding domain
VSADPSAGRLQTFRSVAGNGALVRVLGAYTLFTLSEYSVWLGMLIYAYRHGGATVAGLIAIAQLVPAAVAAPFVAAVADRRSPVVLLAGGYLAQVVGLTATALTVIAGAPPAVYVAAVITATTAVTARPAQATLVPSLAVTAHQLTAANVVVGWVESASVAASGLLTGILVAAGGVAVLFAVCAGLSLGAMILVIRLRATALGSSPEAAPAVLGDLRESLRLTLRRPRLRLIVGLLTAEAIVVGALDLAIVIIAVAVLHRPQAWVGYLNSVTGAGAVLAATVSVLLVGRRLGAPILASAFVFSGVLAALAFGPGVAATLALLLVAGASTAMLDIAGRTLLQRSVPPQLLGRVFGVLEGAMMAGYAVGALLVPLLVFLGGSRAALLGIAAVLPLAAAAGGHGLISLDAEAPVPVVEIALLRSLPLFAELPAPAIEGLAAALTPVEVPAGTVLIRQGDPGDAYYAIAAGEFDVEQDGRLLRRCGRGDGVGEIALLRDVPRTATVTARTAATVYELNRGPFLTAVLGHAPTRRQAARIADARLATDAAAGSSDPPGTATAKPG